MRDYCYNADNDITRRPRQHKPKRALPSSVRAELRNPYGEPLVDNSELQQQKRDETLQRRNGSNSGKRERKKGTNGNRRRRNQTQGGPKIASRGGEEADALDSMYQQTYQKRKGDKFDVDNEENVVNEKQNRAEFERLKQQSANNKLLLKFYKNKRAIVRKVAAKRNSNCHQGDGGGLRNQTAPGGSQQYEPAPQQYAQRAPASAGQPQYGRGGSGNYNVPAIQEHGFGARSGQISSNTFANGMHQNSGNVITNRSSVRLHQQPGGNSSLSLSFDAGTGAGAGPPACTYSNSPIQTNYTRNVTGSNDNSFAHGGRLTVSSNSFANGMHQNVGNHITNRSSVRLHHAPGGHSQMGGLLYGS